jgi:hypothetical protein
VRIHLPSFSFRALIWMLCRYFGRAKELPGVKELFESRKKEEDEENATHTFYKKFTNQGPAYFGDVDEADGELLKYEEAAEQEGMFVASSMAGSSPNSWQSGKGHMHTYAKCLAFPLIDHLYLQYRVGQAHIHPTSHHGITLHQPRQMASARRPMGMVPRHQNPTVNLSNAQNRMHRSRLPVRCRRIHLPLHWHMPVQLLRTFPSYLWKASCRQRCRQRRKWRVCFSSCVSAHWSMSILGISPSCTTVHHQKISKGLLLRQHQCLRTTAQRAPRPEQPFSWSWSVDQHSTSASFS